MPAKKQNLIDQQLQDLNNDGVDRRGCLKCMKHSIKTAPSQLIYSILWMAVCAAMLTLTAAAQTGAWLMPSHDEQHSALSTVQSQALDTIHWHVPVDLSPPQGEITIHYGSPLVTAANTVIMQIAVINDSTRPCAVVNGTPGMS